METQLKFEDLQTGKHKVAISLQELVNSTNSFSVKNVPGCVAKLTSSNPKELMLRYKVTCHLKNSDPNGHDVKVRFDTSQVKDRGTLAKNLDIKVSCSCKAELFWGAQWHLYQQDALEGPPRPKLQAPKERLDLRDGFRICKHIAVVLKRVLPSVQHNVDNIVRGKEMEERKHIERHNPKLEEKQRLLKERQLREREKSKVKKEPTIAPPNKELSDKFRKKIKEQEHEEHTIKRDEPSTPQEKQHIPKIPANEVPIPPVETDEEELAELQPQKIPDMTEEDEEMMEKLSQEPNALEEEEE